MRRASPLKGLVPSSPSVADVAVSGAFRCRDVPRAQTMPEDLPPLLPGKYRTKEVPDCAMQKTRPELLRHRASLVCRHAGMVFTVARHGKVDFFGLRLAAFLARK